jgi:hypothetical protein
MWLKKYLRFSKQDVLDSYFFLFVPYNEWIGRRMLLICLYLKIEYKHLLHINARMQVWRKGYGLLCDVNGVLYVYKRA